MPADFLTPKNPTHLINTIFALRSLAPSPSNTSESVTNAIVRISLTYSESQHDLIHELRPTFCLPRTHRAKLSRLCPYVSVAGIDFNSTRSRTYFLVFRLFLWRWRVCAVRCATAVSFIASACYCVGLSSKKSVALLPAACLRRKSPRGGRLVCVCECVSIRNF